MNEIVPKYRFVVELDIETANRLAEMSQKRGVSKSAMVRFLVNEYYEKEFRDTITERDDEIRREVERQIEKEYERKSD